MGGALTAMVGRAAAAGASADANVLFAAFVITSPPYDSVTGTSLTAAGNAYGDTTNEQMVFDGTGDWYTFPGGTCFDPTTNWTLEFHANIAATQIGGLFSRGSTSVTSRYSPYLTGNGTLEFYCEKYNFGNSPLLSYASAMNGTERHYAICRDGGTWRLYVDGVQRASTSWSDRPDASTDTFYIGTDAFNATARDLAGTIARFVISDTCRYPNGTTFTPPSRTSHIALPPVFTAGPSIAGNTWVGQTLTLSETDTGTSRTIQWKQDGSAISGATSSTYVVQSGDVGHSITCTVTTTSTYGSTSATSNGLGPITATDPLAAIRGSRLAYVNNTNSCTLTLPTGSTAGDLMVLFCGHAYGASTPSGWTSRNSLTGSNYNGAVFTKTLSSGDISTGSVTVSFAGSYYGTVVGVTFVGGTSGYRDIGASRNGSGASSRTVTTGSSPQAGDYLLLFGSARVNSAVSSSSLASTLQSNTQSESSGICRFGLAGSGGSQSGTVNYSGSPSGDYQALVAIAP